MLHFVRYVLKSLWRHRARTILTVSGAAVALFVFCIVGSVQEGLKRLTSDDDSLRTLVVFQQNRFCPTSSRLPESYAKQIADQPGVTRVLPLQVWTNNCRASLDIVVFNAAPPELLQKSRKLAFSSGGWEGLSRRDGAIIGKNLAMRRTLKVGDQFTIGDLSVKVGGVFTSQIPAEENLIYTRLDYLQLAQGTENVGTVTQFEVFLDSQADPDVVSRSVDETLRSGAVATTTRRKGAFQASTLADLVDLIGFAHWLGYACVAMVLSLVATTTIMAVQDRMKEYAILQTIGLRPARVFRLVITESTLQSLIGGLLGTGAALSMLAWSGFAIGAEGVTIAFQPTWSLAIVGSIISLFIGIAAGIIPALQAANMPILKSLK